MKKLLSVTLFCLCSGLFYPRPTHRRFARLLVRATNALRSASAGSVLRIVFGSYLHRHYPTRAAPIFMSISRMRLRRLRATFVSCWKIALRSDHKNALQIGGTACSARIS
jgi:hypothetical protein